MTLPRWCAQPSSGADASQLVAVIADIANQLNRALAGRYLKQANQTMVVKLAQAAGVSPDRLYFNIAHVGNTSAATIPLALYDAVRDGVIDRPLRVFALGFGAGAVAGYAILRFDPAVVADEPDPAREQPVSPPLGAGSSEDAVLAFGP